MCVVALTSACGGTITSQYPTQVAADQGGGLSTGDVVEVRVFYGSEELTREYRIGSHGTIAVPYIGKVAVSGRAPHEVEAEVQRRLADGYLRDPIVSLNVKEQSSKKIAVMGQVRTPGTLSYFDGMTIVEAVSQAGGFTALAKQNSVTVMRSENGVKKRYTIPVGAIAQSQAKNFPMRPGDSIYVPERLF